MAQPYKAKLSLIFIAVAVTTAAVQANALVSASEKQALKQLKDMRRNNDQRGVRVFLHNIKIETSSEEFCRAVADETLKNLSDFRPFLTFLNAAIKKYPRSQSLYLARAQVWIASNELDLAEPDIVKAVGIDPGRPDALALYALFLRDKGDCKKALLEMNKAIAAGAANPYGYDLKASILQQLGRIDEAVTAYRQAIKLAAPADVWHPRSHLAAALKAAKRYEEAAHEYDILYRIDRPGKEDLRLEIAVCLMATGKYKEALKYLEPACKDQVVYWHKLRKECFTGLKDSARAQLEEKKMMQISREYPWTGKGGD
jgi:tetratricopeptide (TPR) repeat protein